MWAWLGGGRVIHDGASAVDSSNDRSSGRISSQSASRRGRGRGVRRRRVLRREERVGEVTRHRRLRDDLTLLARGRGIGRRRWWRSLRLYGETGLDPKLAHGAARAGKLLSAIGQELEQRGVAGGGAGEGGG